jgi:pimeloyl-ACP methyl ester carboxylesterase
VHGRHDYQVPMAATYEFYRHLRAPHQTFTILDNAAHGALYEQPEDFRRLMRRIAAGGAAKYRQRPGPDAGEGTVGR